MDGNRSPRGAGTRSSGEKRLSCSPEQVLEVVRRAQSGDVSAEHDLHDILKPKLLATLARYRCDLLVSEELDGEGYLLLHNCIMRFDARWGVNFFIFLDRMLRGNTSTVVRRERTKARRCQAARTALASGDETDGDAPADPGEPFEPAIRKERGWMEQSSRVEEVVVIRVTLEEAVKTLPRRQWQVYTLWAADNTVQEIAAALGMKEKTCYEALKRMRASLQEALQKMS